MLKLDREKAISLVVLLGLVLAAIMVPGLSLMARSDASRSLADEQEMLARLEAAHQRLMPKQVTSGQISAAPDSAFLSAPTSGLAGAQFEAYLSSLALTQQASVISSGVQPAAHAESPEVIHIQTTLDVRYDSLQTLLYRLETGMPYVFIDALTMQPPSSSQRQLDNPTMKVVLSLHALWQKTDHEPSN